MPRGSLVVIRLLFFGQAYNIYGLYRQIVKKRFIIYLKYNKLLKGNTK
ncbi:hypothetical protein SAMN05660297_01749 [Natronincola peptidivorans]|uniref:Uncharacterized protein n=1 Tax=Natronincola peptidivorans TaxID=426128 RepID=A0A1I0CUP4_9FIRM|nr:hypothetical protein SAMN05660297_01749 [Natronincola peptidivorans]